MAAHLAFQSRTSVAVFLAKVPRQVKLELQHSEYFHVVGPKDAGTKVASGMPITFTVLFTPKEDKVLDTQGLESQPYTESQILRAQ